MKGGIICFYVVFIPVFAFGQTTKVLHYSETSGYDHQTRAASFNMFQLMGNEYGFTVDNDSTGDAFDSLNNLQQYDAVIFSNTSGNSLLDINQQQNFEQYISNGGALIGIHAASDTYRHSSANGNNTGSWDWYAETLGASVQENPNHVTGTPVYRIDALSAHSLLAGIPNPWYKAEEYYYWENGYFNSANNVLQNVEQTVGPNSQVNSYDSARAVTWYSTLPNDGKVFYTSLGHAATNYTSDTSFYRLLANAVQWVGDNTLSLFTPDEHNDFVVYPNPVTEKIIVECKYETEKEICIYSVTGKEMGRWKKENEKTEIDLSSFCPGIYFIKLNTANFTIRR